MTPERAIIENAEDPPVCTCKTCSTCEGDGAVVTEWRYFPGESNRGPNCATREPVAVETCSFCQGSGEDRSECELHYWRQES